MMAARWPLPGGQKQCVPGGVGAEGRGLHQAWAVPGCPGLARVSANQRGAMVGAPTRCASGRLWPAATGSLRAEGRGRRPEGAGGGVAQKGGIAGAADREQLAESTSGRVSSGLSRWPRAGGPSGPRMSLPGSPDTQRPRAASLSHDRTPPTLPAGIQPPSLCHWRNSASDHWASAPVEQSLHGSWPSAAAGAPVPVSGGNRLAARKRSPSALALASIVTSSGRVASRGGWGGLDQKPLRR